MTRTSENFDLLSEMKDGNNKLLTVLDLSDTIFLLINKEGNVEFINKAGCVLLGYPKNKIIGKNWIKNFIPGNYRDELSKKVEDFYQSAHESFAVNENAILTKSGEEKCILWHNSLIFNEQREVAGILGSGLDITERKKSEKVQQVISKILQAANSSGNLNEFFSFIRTSVSELMPAENFYIALHDREANIINFPYFVDQVDKVAPQKRLGRGLTEYVLRSGKSILVNSAKDEELVASGEVDLIGSPTCIWLGIPLKIQEVTIGVLVVQDYKEEKTYGDREKEILEVISFAISRAIERKRVEEEKSDLIEKLRQLNTSKDKLISLISHDLRSPFNSLLGFSEILNSEYDSLTHDEIREYLRVIYDTSKNLYNMTNNLLQFSRIQMGRVDFNPTRINLSKLIRTSLNLIKGNAIKKQINLLLDVDNSIYVIVDEDMINSIIQNLVSNAIKFTRKGGDVKISATKTEQADGGFIKVSVEDNGIGMSEASIENIFGNKINSTPGTEKEYGTGLGLLLVKEFVEKNGGRLSVHSKVNSGSTFSFTIPEEKE